MADIIITPGSSIMSFTSSANYTQTLTQDASGSLVLQGSGSTGRTDLFTVNGNNGTLFSVSDDLSDSLFSVNTIAGLPVIEAFANNTVVLGKYGQNDLVVSGSRVGIGTSAPSSKLHLQGTTTLLTITDTSYNRTSNIGYADSANLYFANDSNSNTYIGAYNNLFLAYGGGLVGIGTTNPGERLTVNGSIGLQTSGTQKYHIGYWISGLNFAETNVADARLFIKDGGNVGIGTSNPGNKFVVNGGISGTPSWDNNTIEVRAESGLTAAISLHRAGYTTAEIYSDNGAIAFRESGADRLRITSGNVGVGTTNPSARLDIRSSASSGATNAPTFRAFGLDTDSYFQVNNNSNNSADITLTRSDSATMFNIDGHSGTTYFAGNVGIGSTNPQVKLDVLGTGHFGSPITSDQGLGIYSSNGNDSYSRIRFYQSSTNIHTIHSFSTSWQGGTIYNASAGALNLSGWNGITIGPWNDADAIFVAGGASYFKGNVGIGTTSPTVISNYRTNTLDASSGTFTEYRQGGTNLLRIGADGSRPFLYGNSNAPLDFFTNASFRMRLAANGDLLVGTQTSIHGTSGRGVIQINGSSNAILSLSIGDADSGYIYHTGTDMYLWNYKSGAMFLGTSNNTRMTILSGGNVGIGTTNPIYKLEVNGTSGFNNEMYVTGYSTYWYNGTTYFQVTNSSNVGILKMTNNVNAISLQPDGGNVGIGTTSPSSKLDVNGYITTSDGNLELYKGYTVDMSNTGTYSTSNYYPVIIPIGTEPVLIQVQNNLNSNVPSWATHPAGFTLNVRWITNGSGWGTTQVKRKVQQYHENWASTTICGGITQMTQSSTEVIWLRGGGTYFFKLSRNFTPSPQASTYTSNGQSVSPTSTAQNTVWNAASGTENYYAGGIYAEMFYDANDNGYYLDPANISNLYTSYFGGVVGIGTTSPSSKLHIQGNATDNVGLALFQNSWTGGGLYYPTATFVNSAGNHSYGIVAGFKIGNASGTDRPSILFYNDAGSHSWQVGQITSGWGNTDAFGIGYRASNDPNSFGGWPSNYFTILVGGNVGIGTTNPGFKLDVDAGSTTDVARFYNSSTTATSVYIGDTGNSNYSVLVLDSNASAAQIWKGGASYSNWGGAKSLNIYNGEGPIAFHSNNTANSMFLDTSGNLGIGTTSISYKLDVNGTTRVVGGIIGQNSSNDTRYEFAPDLAYTQVGVGSSGDYKINSGAASLTSMLRIKSTSTNGWLSSIKYFNGTVISEGLCAEVISTAGTLVFLTTDGEWGIADADVAAKSVTLLGIALNDTSNIGDKVDVLIDGIIALKSNHDQISVPASPGAPLFVSTNAGNVTEVAPAGTGDIVRLVGHNIWSATSPANTAVIRFQPDATWIEL